MSFFPELIRWLTHTPVNSFVMGYRWVCPISETLHFCGLVLMVGTATISLALLVAIMCCGRMLTFYRP